MENCQFHEFSGSPVVLQISYEKNMTSRWEVFFLSGKGDKETDRYFGRNWRS